MKLNYKLAAIALVNMIVISSCSDDDSTIIEKEVIKEVEKEVIADLKFDKISEYLLSGNGIGEISAYDKETKQIFSTNTENKVVEVIDISDVGTPKFVLTIDVTPYGGNLNGVAVEKGMLAVAVQGNDKNSDKGRVVIFETTNLTTPIINLEVGFLPDMVTFSPDGKYALVANEAEPNNFINVDNKGTISIVDIAAKSVNTLDFTFFNNQEAALEARGFRVTGETKETRDINGVRTKNTLDIDVEPEYITVSDDSKMAYVSLQENNGIAVVDLVAQRITEILPLGTKSFDDGVNLFDVSDKDDKFQLNEWNVKSFFMPDAIEYVTIGGIGYLITANEGDGREYLDDKGTDSEDDDEVHYTDEAKVEKVDLDPEVYVDTEIKEEKNLGRLKISVENGDKDMDGEFEQLFTFGGRSFTIWNLDGTMVYDSGNFLGLQAQILGTYNDGRSDAKGVEPESVTTLKVGAFTLAFVGLERSGNVFVFDISNPMNPVYLQNLQNVSPEGLVAVSAEDSPNGKELLIVSNEKPDNAGKINIYSRK